MKVKDLTYMHLGLYVRVYHYMSNDLATFGVLTGVEHQLFDSVLALDGHKVMVSPQQEIEVVEETSLDKQLSVLLEDKTVDGTAAERVYRSAEYLTGQLDRDTVEKIFNLVRRGAVYPSTTLEESRNEAL